MGCTLRSFLKIRIFRRNRNRIQKILACLLGAQMGSNHEKTGGQKSRDTLPLIAFRSRFFTFLKFFHHTIMFSVEKGVQLVHFYI